MIITKITESSKSFSKIYADGEFLMPLANELIKKYALSVGSEIDIEKFSELSHAAQVRKARERMLYALDRRLHSEKELRDKLKKDYPSEVIDEAIEILKGLNLIDDSKFALAFASDRKSFSKKGPYIVAAELSQKGVSREIISEAIESVFSDREEQLETAIRLILKYESEIDTPNGKRKAYALLARRGFESSVINAAIRSVERE